MYLKYFLAFFVVGFVFFLLDLYFLNSFKLFYSDKASNKKIKIIFWSISISCFILSFYSLINNHNLNRILGNSILIFFTLVFIPKTFMLIPIIIDEFRRLSIFIFSGFKIKKIKRSKILLKTSLILGLIVFISLFFAIFFSNDLFRIKKQTVYFTNLPASFDGKKIAVFSDIHLGNTVFKSTVEHGIKLMLDEKPDIIFFTGDLVSFKSSEAIEFTGILKQVKAPLGVYSILGNHDYGDYAYWNSVEDKLKDMDELKEINKNAGWNLLLNENKLIGISNDTIAILGVENWGNIHRFTRRGDISKAYKGTEKAHFKILLSHDPSHWKAEVLPKLKDIDLTFSGHTHAFQFGYEIGKYKWSPSKYIYEYWYGLYNIGNQYLYVNRGFGTVGLLGRLGMFPEITIIELKKK